MIALAAVVVLAVVAAIIAWAFGVAAGARRAKLALGAVQRRSDALLRNLPDASVIVFDRDGTIEQIEGNALDARGWTHAEVVGRGITDILQADRVGPWLSRIQAAVDGQRSNLDWSGLRGGEYRVEFAPMLDGAGETRALVVVRDEAERRALERELERQRLFLASVLDSLEDQVIACDTEGRVQILNRPETEIDPGLDPAEWAGAFGLVQEDGSPAAPHEHALYQAFHGREIHEVDQWFESPEGRRVFVATGGPLVDADGRPLGAMVTYADVTGRRRIEDELRANEARYLALVQGVRDCVFQTDLAGRWTFLNEAWTRATGFPVADSIGRHAVDFVHPEDRAAHARTFGPLLAGRVEDVQLRHRFRAADGTVRWAEVRATAATRADGAPIGFVGVMQDVTEDELASRYARAEQAVVSVLAEAESSAVAQPRLLEVLCRNLDWDCAELWRFEPRSSLLECAFDWTPPDSALREFTAGAQGLAFEVGDGIAGQSWVSDEPIWRPALSRESGFRRAVEAAEVGLRSAVGLPIRGDSGPVAVIVLFSRERREPEPGLSRLLETVGAHTAQFLNRRAAEERRIQHAADLSALARVTQQLSAETDMDIARRELCRSGVELVEASSVVLWEPFGGAPGLGVTAAHGADVAGLRGAPDEQTGAAAAFRTGASTFVGDLASDPAVSARWLEITGGGSTIWLPVLRDGRVSAVLAVSWSEPRAQLGSRHGELLRLLAAETAATMQRIDLLSQLRQTSRTDPLTGLANRRVWDDELERELARARRHSTELALSIVDLDHFKVYNDANGHQAGDQLLKASASAWRASLRPTDILARYGGEEFAVLLPHTDAGSARATVERMLALVPLEQTASAGIAIWNGTESGEALLARADAALYVAKAAGRARAAFAT